MTVGKLTSRFTGVKINAIRSYLVLLKENMEE